MKHSPNQPILGALLPAKERKAARPADNAGKIGFTVVGLFAGIGGIELGLHEAGHRTELLCEIDPGARAVLSAHFPGVPLVDDVRELAAMPAADVISAGFPCQDLSQAGRTAGIRGRQSSLVGELFRLLEDDAKSPRWLLLENVPFMLQLQRGHAMDYLATRLEEAGYSWAYRIVDAQGFGLPQRRRRVILLASRSEDPREVLFVDDAGVPPEIETENSPCGFYWTEGSKGLGWAVDAVPTIKGGSTIGIPSPPAIWMRSAGGEIVHPEIRDVERLQGFPAGWALPAVSAGKVRSGMRWKLVGNAVCVPVARWIGECLSDPRPYEASWDRKLSRGSPWPNAAWGAAGERFSAEASPWPVARDYQHLSTFFQYPTLPLSLRASAGFYRRASASSLRFASEFLEAVAKHIETMKRRRPLEKIGPEERHGPASTGPGRREGPGRPPSPRRG